LNSTLVVDAVDVIPEEYTSPFPRRKERSLEDSIFVRQQPQVTIVLCTFVTQFRGISSLQRCTNSASRYESLRGVMSRYKASANEASRHILGASRGKIFFSAKICLAAILDYEALED